MADYHARSSLDRIAELETRVSILVDGVLGTLLALRAAAKRWRAPNEYIAEIDALGERIFAAHVETTGAAAEGRVDGPGP